MFNKFKQSEGGSWIKQSFSALITIESREQRTIVGKLFKIPQHKMSSIWKGVDS